jgi:hypothetical protein
VALALHSACLMQLEFHQLDRRWENAPSYGMKRLAPADWKSYRLAFCGTRYVNFSNVLPSMTSLPSSANSTPFCPKVRSLAAARSPRDGPLEVVAVEGLDTGVVRQMVENDDDPLPCTGQDFIGRLSVERGGRDQQQGGAHERRVAPISDLRGSSSKPEPPWPTTTPGWTSTLGGERKRPTTCSTSLAVTRRCLATSAVCLMILLIPPVRK